MGSLKYHDGTQFQEAFTFSQKGTASFSTLSVNSEGGTRTTDVTGFNNRSLIRKLKVTPTEVGVDSYVVEFFSSDTFGSSTLLYQATGNGTLIDNEIWFHEDTDETSELHLKITNNSTTASTFSVELTQEEFF